MPDSLSAAGTTPQTDTPMPPIPPAVRAQKPVLITEGPVAGLPSHFAWPAMEQEAFEEGQGLAFLGPIGVVEVRGQDRLSWLTTLSSQVLDDLTPGISKELLLLDQNGRIEFAAGAIDDGQSTWLLVEPQFAEGLTDFLCSMQFMLRVEVSDLSGNYVGFARVAPAVRDTADAPDAGGALIWTDPWPGVTPGGAVYFQGPHPGGSTRFQIIAVPRDQVDAFVETWLATEGRSLVGLLAANATRVAAWRPLVSAEVDDRTLPAELDWLRTAVHTNKGCYRGQESVARIINLGRPPRRLVFLQLDGSGGEVAAEVIPGAPVELDGRQVGVVTSVAQHYEMGPIALALVKRNLNADAQLKVSGVDARQELIVPVDGRSNHAPKERPGAGLRRLDPTKHDIRTTGPGAKR